jgi:hypothetical protein
MTDFTFFEAALEEEREYQTTSAGYISLVRHFAAKGVAEVVSDDETVMRFRVGHVLTSDGDAGLDSVEKRLGVSLPDDIRAFYARWGACRLMLRLPYRLLSPEEIVEETLHWRGKHRPGEPVRVVRFCRFSGHVGWQQFVLRLDEARGWEVFCANPGYSEADILHGSFADGGESGGVTDRSFAAWLRRLCETDGWPYAPGSDDRPEWLAERL